MTDNMNKFEVNTSDVDEEIIINEFDALEIENSTSEVEAILTHPRPNAFLQGLENSQEEDKNHFEKSPILVTPWKNLKKSYFGDP